MYALLEVHEDAEVFVVLEGSSLKHVVPVLRQAMFCFTSPGECVCVCVCPCVCVCVCVFESVCVSVCV